MRKEFECKACSGIGFFCNDHECSDLLYNIDSCADCGGKIKCNNCNGTGHLPLPEMLMMVNEALCDANMAFRGDVRCDHKSIKILSLTDESTCSKIELAIDHYRMFTSRSAEHHLALAAVRLREIAGIVGINTESEEYKGQYLPERRVYSEISEELYNLAVTLRPVWRKLPTENVDSVFSYFISRMEAFCNHHKIDLSAHVEALVAYEKESD